MRRKKIVWLVSGAALLAMAGILSLADVLHERDGVTALRDSLAVLRAAADSCRVAVDDDQAGLHEYSERLDSLRGRVRGLEAHDPRGVPADSFGIYMEVFERYNDSARAWDARVDSLQAGLQRCRAVTESHNMLADSLRRLLSPSRQRR
jgi:hypothetical protein